jgi:hypothetical protein
MANKKATLKLIQGKAEDEKNSQGLKESQETSEEFPGSESLEKQLDAQVGLLKEWIYAKAKHPHKFKTIEQGLITILFKLGCLALMLYLAKREEQLMNKLPQGIKRYKKWFVRTRWYKRTIHTFLGPVTYWRSYYYHKRHKGQNDEKNKDDEKDKGQGFHPLDHELGLTRDKFSLHLISLAARLAVMMPFASAAELLKLFIGTWPSEKAIEHMVLGLGAYTQSYFEKAMAPEGDGEVLVIMIDCKAVPTATDSELKKRRGKRKKRKPSPSPRHRGRELRRGQKRKQRKKKGDKSKNGRAATLVVMYTLKKSEDGKLLLGPINKKVYASFAPKRLGFEYAQKQAAKRGFPPGSGKIIQFVSDGDDDFRVYLDEYFGGYGSQELILTIDLPHVMEYLWKAGSAHFAEGSDELKDWAYDQKMHLLESRADLVLKELKKLLKTIPQSGPGNKSRRQRTEKAIKYLSDNLDRMDYLYYSEEDLELASGAVEGAVNHVIGLRMDRGGMRWIVERAEAVLQLRCIHINGDWDEFIEFVEKEIDLKHESGSSVKILCDKPVGLPVLRAAA